MAALDNDQSSIVLGHIVNKSGDGFQTMSIEGVPDSVTARQYLERTTFPILEKALNNVMFHLFHLLLFQLLEKIQENGEFEKYSDEL